ncbi:DUF190 domain-containing protein [Geobacter sp. DSM 9736]|uniref:DUF190 domain-containing protein n=1 Tax=Geobacter sp. DSM 9736 TaxID=1277350 RepID=UPI000B4FD77A|nr:DUF190 domain-containing protein [Geobacter sp. DSM 9736]SNB47936.1 hypothetical protein SAMN06269301_3430 [Geobacter sp. DSM 9736]
MAKVREKRVLMRIFIGESEKFNHTPLYEALLELFRREGVAGATVLRGVAGFGARGIIHTHKLLELSTDLPLVIEVIEEQGKLDSLMPQIDSMMTGGTITTENVVVTRYGTSSSE